MEKNTSRVELMTTQQHKDFEDIRYVLKKEQKNPNAYTANRRDAMLRRCEKQFGSKAVIEVAKEFKLYRDSR